EPLAGATVHRAGTMLGAAAAADGRVVPARVPGGVYTLRASFVGYATARTTVDVSKVDLLGERPDVVLRLPPSTVEGDEVVVTATRTERVRKEVPVIVNVVDDFVFSSTQALSLSAGLSFEPGLRLEGGCRTWNYTQGRGHGM